VLWGTDSIWYGSPGPDRAFRSFQITDEVAGKFGYPKNPPALRAKVFGRNTVALYTIPTRC
jgi:hypothetical protein